MAPSDGAGCQKEAIDIQIACGDFPANTGRSTNAELMLAHRLRRWPNNKSELDERPVLSGLQCTHGL